MPEGSAATLGLDQPSTKGEDYGDHTFSNANNAQLITPVTSTGSIAVRAHPNNAGNIFIGWDTDVTINNGYPLEPGDQISFDLDINQQGIYGVAANANDSIRFIAVN